MTKAFRACGMLIFAAMASCFAQTIPHGFVLIKGGTFPSGDMTITRDRPLVRVDDFEMLDHPITNSEYEAFVRAEHYPAPAHWRNGQIPESKQDYPVVLINRFDVDAYLAWLCKMDGRAYRLPTTMEFEYASRGGMDAKYPWGNENPAGRANYDDSGKRRFDRWQDYMQPARSGKPNGYGLYAMAGNVWQLTVNLLDPVTTPYKYLITNVPTLEGSIMGGSWARNAEFLRCGNVSEMSSGVKRPDVGFRPIRQPKEAVWRLQPRRLIAQYLGDGKVMLSWSLLAGDTRKSMFNIYRAESRNHSGFLINKTPCLGTTCYMDEGVKTGKRYHYYVRLIDGAGKAGARSEWSGITIPEVPTKAVVTFKPVHHQGSLAPIFGDLDGDGVMDVVIRMDNGNIEESQDPGYPVQLEAFTSWGRSLWRLDVCRHNRCFGSANNVPFNVWDMDGDGKAEVITRLQLEGAAYVAILDGLSGEVKNKTPWPAMATDFQRSSTRIHLSVGYLDGVHPAVITQTGLYENEVFVAYDATLQQLWRFESFDETNGSGGHKIEVVDVNGDAKQEVFDGTTCLNVDGSIRWSIYRQHPDVVSIHDFLPDRPGLEVLYLVESNAHAGIYMVDANTGDVIWKVNREDDPRWTHAHTGWGANIWDGSPGMECATNRAVYTDTSLVLYSAKGEKLLESFPLGYTPIEWDGDPERELLHDNGHRIGQFNGKTVQDMAGVEPNAIPGSSFLMAADVCGDFRDELVLNIPLENGNSAIAVVAATTPVQEAYIAPIEYLDYRLWLARNMGGGYPSIYDHTLHEPR
jgi:rhamnogalacturonan endolyase